MRNGGRLSAGWTIGRLLGIAVFSFAAAFQWVNFFFLLFYERIGDGIRAVAAGVLGLWAVFLVFNGIFRRLAAFSPLLLSARGWRIARLSAKGCIAEPPPGVKRGDLIFRLFASGTTQAALGLLLLLIGAFFGESPAGYVLRCAGFLGLLQGTAYLFPHEQRGSGNDGYFLWRMKRFPQTERLLTLLLRIDAACTRADSYAAFPDSLREELARYECADYSYRNEVVPLYYHGHVLFAQGDRAGAREVYRKIAESPAPEEFRRRAFAELFYFAMLEGAPEEELKALYQQAVGSRVSDNTSRHRVMLAYFLLWQKDAPKAKEEYQILSHMAAHTAAAGPGRMQAALDLREAEHVRALAGETEAVGRA